MRITRWQPPWPPIQIGVDEWIIMRDSHREPAAIIRRSQFGEHEETWFRIVKWAARSEDRELIGWVRTLELADMAIKFTPPDGEHLRQFSPARTKAEWEGHLGDRARYLG